MSLKTEYSSCLCSSASYDLFIFASGIAMPAKEQKEGKKPERSKFEKTKAMAEQGDANAQSYLGKCYFEGEGVEQDRAQAVYWYSQAAKQGDAAAQAALKQLEEG